ncbi:ATP-binding protein [Neobacillus drentensis]|uniref:ATP-binding protein n=1 Tax=Neobacillus drentensis TaxID=220684 RepID=UPI003000200C
MSEREPIYITQSKKMCEESGMDPNEIASPKHFLTSQDLDFERKAYREVLSVVSYFSKKLMESLKGTPVLICISDSNGYLLDMVGDETIKSTIEKLGINVGCLFTQEDMGTNVISLTLQQRHPVKLIGQDHYHKFLYEIACYGAPFHYTDEDNLLGSVSIMTPVYFQNPLLLTMLSQVVDSIERELLLRKQNRKLNILNQIMLDRTKNGIVITDENGIIVEFNDFAQQIFNESRSSVIGKIVYESILNGDYFKRIIKNEEKQENLELKFINKNGDLVVCLFDAQPIYEEEKVVGAFGQYRDITEWYLLDEKIKEAEKQALAGQIAAGIAHEIRNPLTTVRGYLQFLGSDVEEKVAQIFDSLLIPEIDRANKIISDFLRITKPSDQELEMIQVDKFLNDYLCEFLKSESLLYNADIELEILPASKYLSIHCNRGELLQVFINLFQNSLQAKGDSFLKINISTKLVNSHIQILFSDNGIGIEPSILRHIFDPFFSTKDTGTGLGLSVSRKIVENHKGTIRASSNGNGTKFTIELPVYQ